MHIDDTFKMVKRAIDIERPAHGYLIIGPVRSLAMTLTERILQLLFCRSAEKPCGACDGCRHVIEKLEVDIHWIFPEKKSRVISVDQIREDLINEVTQTSFSGGWKAGVIVGADRMTDQAANAFLKTLEEPSAKTVFLLLSDAPQQILPTILSRCQRIDLEDMRGLSEPWKGRLLETLASPSYGKPLENLAMSNILFSILVDMKNKASQLVNEEATLVITGEEEDDDVFDAKVGARYRELRVDFLLEILRWYRDLMILKVDVTSTSVYNYTYMVLLKERAARLTLAQTLYNLTAIEELICQMERSLSEETLLAYALDRLNHGVN